MKKLRLSLSLSLCHCDGSDCMDGMNDLKALFNVSEDEAFIGGYHCLKNNMLLSLSTCMFSHITRLFDGCYLIKEQRGKRLLPISLRDVYRHKMPSLGNLIRGSQDEFT